MTMADVRRTRGVPARRGMRVTVDGRPGRITSARRGGLRILLDGERRPGLWHPTWRITYHTDAGDIAFDDRESPQRIPEGPHGE